ncbi:RNA polymerase sigma-70 factor (ECF subfamily) [Agromyces ramosus]|uniref:RNA polymerase sigma-70 factor (ECF subfamily) n=1 Tax=Agromyces ramosus TaxID=33879 RepID=A0A4Q7MJ26_9MICO|nr:sigma-70 family RNA polymerase sigma factor [Agromyces ramosus]RZS67827.1 RNA polymerase sigma-70 factor (ECF subfamily) [Agromyces ramosus]
MARSWDEVATRLVVERGDALSRYAYLLTGSVDDAADLVQEALVRTFGTPRLGLTLPRAEAYVRRAILNQVIDRSRRDGTWRRVRHLAVAPAAVDSSAPASDDRLDLFGRLRELPPRQAACIVLRYYDDLTVDGIAGVLGISSGAVKRYLSDGLRTLSSSIDPDGTRSARAGGENVST